MKEQIFFTQSVFPLFYLYLRFSHKLALTIFIHRCLYICSNNAQQKEGKTFLCAAHLMHVNITPYNCILMRFYNAEQCYKGGCNCKIVRLNNLQANSFHVNKRIFYWCVIQFLLLANTWANTFDCSELFWLDFFLINLNIICLNLIILYSKEISIM